MPRARDVEQFLLAFDSDLAPIVGQQITLTATNASVAGPRIDLLLKRAGGAIPVEIPGRHSSGMQRGGAGRGEWGDQGYLYDPATGNFALPNFSATIPDAMLRALASTPGQEVTYTAWPTGSGIRVISTTVPTRRRGPVR